MNILKRMPKKKPIDITDTAAWIEAHGSERLKRMHAEGIECRGVYLDEWLAQNGGCVDRELFLDQWIATARPGWQWSFNVDADLVPPRNVPMEAFHVLDAARDSGEPTAKLWYCRSKQKGGWKGDVAVAERFGYDMIWGFEVGEGR